jgi:hypothetical protein
MPPRRRAAAALRSFCLLSLVLFGWAPPAFPASTSAPAALLVYPLIQVDSSIGLDTEVVITNSSAQPVRVGCFYEGSATAGQAGRLVEMEFELTPHQPIAWSANAGMAQFPLVERPGPGGYENRRSLIPRVPGDPFVGTLRCFTIADGQSRRRNALTGNVSIERGDDAGIDVLHIPAMGFEISATSGSTPAQLVLSDGQGEYAGCAQDTHLGIVSDGAVEPVAGATVTTELVLVPCSRDYTTLDAEELELSFQVVNAFGQRLSTVGRSFAGPLVALSSIDADTPERSIFHAASLGSFSAQLEVRPLRGSGVLVAAVESHAWDGSPGHVRRTAAIGYEGRPRRDADTIVLREDDVEPQAYRVYGCVPHTSAGGCGNEYGTVTLEPGSRSARVEHGHFEFTGVVPGEYLLTYSPRCNPWGCRPPIRVTVMNDDVGVLFWLDQCAGDCDRDGAVGVHELVSCVDAALQGGAPACTGCDVSGDGIVTVDEILRATTSALQGCWLAAE